jgi:hypothetical protein
MTRITCIFFLALTPVFAQYSITVTGARFPEFVENGNAAEILVTAPNARSASEMSVRLNGAEVSGLRASADAAVRTAELTGLKAGPNHLQVFSARTAKSPVAEFTVSTAIAPVISCDQLRGVTLTGLDATNRVTIDSAVPAAASQNLPAHCVVRGSADPHDGVNNTHFAIGFEVRLPDRWSGRFLFQGGPPNPSGSMSRRASTTPGTPTARRL